MLYRLILADRTVEHDPLLRVCSRPLERRAAQADGFGRNEDALWIQAVKYVLEAPALIPDAVRDRDLQAVDEDLVGIDGAPAHLRNLAGFDEAAVEVGIEQ